MSTPELVEVDVTTLDEPEPRQYESELIEVDVTPFGESPIVEATFVRG